MDGTDRSSSVDVPGLDSRDAQWDRFVHPKVVAERLGHSDVKVTLSVYSHLLPGVQEEAAEKVAGLILAAM